MNTETIIRLLENSGFHNVHADTMHIYMEDPSCILRSFQTFSEFAWVIISVFTGLMLTGWAISIMRGAKNDIFNNLKNLILLFGVLSVMGPVINLIYGDDIFARGCKTISAPIEELNKILDTRKEKLNKGQNELYEVLSIQDTGPIQIIKQDNISQEEINETFRQLENYETINSTN